ncbi:MAG: hypothetical protein CMC15_15670 [Flavobacteriaceae bacterium]|nr:hypothetical protein [Flavobacteriaceae bacterium]
MTNINYKYNDGGKPKTVKGKGDCVVRAITIASGLPYTEVADALRPECRKHNKLIKAGKRTTHRGKNSLTSGIHKEVYHSWLLSNGWTWTPTMLIGQGCKVHLTKSELPKGTIIARVSRHLVACIDGVINDTYDCSRNGTRCVYGYYTKK